MRSFHLSLADTYPNLIKIRYHGQTISATSPALRICKPSASSYTSHSCSIVDLHVSFSTHHLSFKAGPTMIGPKVNFLHVGRTWLLKLTLGLSRMGRYVFSGPNSPTVFFQTKMKSPKQFIEQKYEN